MDHSLSLIKSMHANAVIPKCCEHKCKVDFGGVPAYVILKGETLAGRKTPVCDCIVFDTRKRLTASLIEIKSFSFDVDQITKQFEGGGKKALEVADKLGRPQPRLIIGLVAKGYRRWAQSSVLVKTKVSIGQKRHQIALYDCNIRLVDMECSVSQDGHKPGKMDAGPVGDKRKARTRKQARSGHKGRHR